MNTSLEIKSPAIKVAALTGPAAVSAVARVAYVDMIRIVLCALVIVVHAACTFGAMADWTFVDPTANDETTSVVLSLFILYCQSFFMGLFFFLSGYFTPAAYDRKGTWQFWKDRLVRLAIPLAAYTWFLSRIPNYLDEWRSDGLRESFWKYSLRTFWIDGDAAHTWFLSALLLFSAGYTLYRLVSKNVVTRWESRRRLLPTPGTPALLGTAVALSAAMFVVGQFFPMTVPFRVFGVFPYILPFFAFYVVLFPAGVLAYRNNWLERMDTRMLPFWKWMSVGLIAALPVFLLGTGVMELGIEPYISGFSWRCAVMCLWFGFCCISFSTFLTLWMREKVQPSNHLVRSAGPLTFAVYFIHPLVLVPITLLLSYTAIHPMLKFILASVTTIPICFGLAAGLRRIPGVKAVL